MTIDTKILKQKPREESGSKTSRKYQFQKDLSLYILIKEHLNRDDYLFLFDFHEDLIISNSSQSLKELECIQIKSKDNGNWTINALITKKPKDKNSIIGKLYNNRIVFQDAVKSLTFISNVRYSFEKLKNGSETKTLSHIHAINLSQSDKHKFENSIKSEHSIKVTDFERIGEFKVTTLSNSDSSTHCVGALASLINLLNPSSRINSQLAYEQVLREITRKTNETVGDKTFLHISEVFKIKGLSKGEFLAFLNKAGLYKSIEEEWSEVKTSLEADGITHIELLNYKYAWRVMNARVIADSGNIPLRQLINEIDDILKIEMENIKPLKLLGIVDHIFKIIASKAYDDYFTKCLIINRLHES